MMTKRQTFKPSEQFVKNQNPPKSPQGKPGKKTKVSKAPKKGKTGSQMLTKAMKKFC